MPLYIDQNGQFYNDVAIHNANDMLVNTPNPTFAGTIGKIPADGLGSIPNIFDITLSGALGDGVTDDVGAIQTYLNNLAATYGCGEVVLAPGKFYYIGSAPLTIPPNFIVRGSASGNANQAAVGGSLFSGGGFLINPALYTGIILSGSSQLKRMKVYRQGLIANASQGVATAAYNAWAAEAVYLQTTGTVNSGTNVLPMTNTTGVSVGQYVSGPGAIRSGYTVTAVNPGVSVTISHNVSKTLAAGAWFRFGASCGIQNPSGSSVVIEDVCVIGFRTGIISWDGQFFYNNMRGDCITNLEFIDGGDFCVVENSEYLPLYANISTFSRPGDGIWLHDGGIGVRMNAVFVIGWTRGFRVTNVAGGPSFSNCDCEAIDGAGIENWLIENSSQILLDNCHAQTAGTGFHIKDSSQFVLIACNSSGAPSLQGNCVAHFLFDSTNGNNMYGQCITPNALGGTPGKVPIKFQGANISVVGLTEPYIGDLVTGPPSVPYIQGTLPGSFIPKFLDGIVYIAPSSGSTLVAVWYNNGYIVDNASSPLATLTITLPPQPMDRQVFEIWFNTGVTTLTINTSDGSAVGRVSNPAAGTHQKWIYSLAQNKWFGG